MECISFVWFSILFSSVSVPVLTSKCGCKTMSPCYINMLNVLQEQDEASCIQDASIGTSTITVFLKALREYCSKVVAVDIQPGSVTYDMRHLYEVVIFDTDHAAEGTKDKPTIVIDAGQEGGTESVGFALYLIEQLVACEENKEMIQKVKWVIMPSTNPDGMEYSRYQNNDWKKNLKISEDEITFGVDVSRNFDVKWSACPTIATEFDANYPGPKAGSEKETIFITGVLNKHKRDTKIYLSLRRDGHHIAFPYAYTGKDANNKKQLELIAAEVASKVNMRSGGLHLFANNTIYNFEGKERCGHSVDYALSIGIPWPFEMRLFLRTNYRIMSKFQTMPRGYQMSLQNGYISGVRELYNVLTNKKKYGKLMQ